MNSPDKTNEIIIRPMQREDLPDIILIENASFPSPWPERLFIREMVNPVSNLFVAIAPGWGGDLVLGYIACWLVANDVHVHNLAVQTHFRRRGIASALLDYVLSYYHHQGAQNIYLEVREQNWPAQELYKKFQFRPVGLRHRYYSDTGEDAIVMQRPILTNISGS